MFPARAIVGRCGLGLSMKKHPGILANCGKDPFKSTVRTLQERLDDTKRRSLLTDMDRTLDKRNPWPGYKTELEHEAEQNKRVWWVAFVSLLAVQYLYLRYYDYILAPHNSDKFEVIRKELNVPGSFPPDFETPEEKARWNK